MEGFVSSYFKGQLIFSSNFKKYIRMMWMDMFLQCRYAISCVIYG
jgi:hypothetical protein